MTTRILVVDDDEFTLKLISMQLSRAGYQVFPAQNGLEALDQIDQIQPHLTILDVMMPGVDGYQVCRRLRQKPAFVQLPIMMLTANDSLEHKVKGFEAGADDYMVKPFQSAELDARIQALLRRASATQERGALKTKSKVIAIFSLRGGVGVSTLANNLALALQQIWNQPTTLVDLALTCGQSALMFNLPLRNTWADLASIPLSELDEAPINQALLLHTSGLRVLASPPTPAQGETVKSEYVTKTLQILKEQNHYMVLDLPHDFSDTTLAGMDLADQIVGVMAPEIASVYAMTRTLETYSNLGYESDNVELVLNWIFERRGLARKDIESALGRRVNLIIPYASEPLIKAINVGIPTVMDAPESPLGALFEDLAFFVSKPEHRAKQPAEPTPAWQRVNRRWEQRQQE